MNEQFEMNMNELNVIRGNVLRNRLFDFEDVGRGRCVFTENHHWKFLLEEPTATMKEGCHEANI